MASEVKIHAEGWLFASLYCRAEAMGMYVMLVSRAACDGLGKQVPRKVVREIEPRYRPRRRMLEKLEAHGLLRVENFDIELNAVDESRRWIFLGSETDRYPTAAISQPWRAWVRGRESIPPALRKRVIERDEMVCGICGEAVDTYRELHIDHILPVALGGGNDLDNLQVAHATCNLSKGAKVA